MPSPPPDPGKMLRGGGYWAVSLPQATQTERTICSKPATRRVPHFTEGGTEARRISQGHSHLPSKWQKWDSNPGRTSSQVHVFFTSKGPTPTSRPLQGPLLPHRSPRHWSAVRWAGPRLFRQALPRTGRKGPGLVQSKSNQEVLNIMLATVTIIIH